MFSYEGREAPGIRGYRYFGRARDLPGVRELFEQEVAEPVNRSITEINRDIDANYYGYHDEENQVLLEYEKALEKELAQKLLSTPLESLEKE
ncbi:Putative Pre-mRNA-splicing factor ISY1 [Rhizopus microsporus]|nr:Putative Pre-mRNA-splicing factor ISY1 [Rhizopus microsporus]